MHKAFCCGLQSDVGALAFFLLAEMRETADRTDLTD
jgi:hypothetical protein